MNLKAKVEKLEEKAGIKNPVFVIQMPDETKEQAIRKAKVPPGAEVRLLQVVFGEPNEDKNKIH